MTTLGPVGRDEDEIAADLDALDVDDLEDAHMRAVRLLQEAAGPVVTEAYRRTAQRAEWWVCA